jgi:hypothetical protein
MATPKSVVAAALTKYDSLTAANFPSSTRPPVYFDEAPVTDGAGAQLRPPYVVLKDSGRTPDVLSDYGGTEDGAFTLEVYAASLADVDTIVHAIKWNGQNPGQASGFDCGTLPALTAPYSLMHLLRTGEQRFVAGIDQNGRRMHCCRLTYSALTNFDAE